MTYRMEIEIESPALQENEFQMALKRYEIQSMSEKIIFEESDYKMEEFQDLIAEEENESTEQRMAIDRYVTQSNQENIIDDQLLEFDDIITREVNRTSVQIDRQKRAQTLKQILAKKNLGCVTDIILDYADTKLSIPKQVFRDPFGLGVSDESPNIYCFCCKQSFKNENINKCMEIERKVRCSSHSMCTNGCTTECCENKAIIRCVCCIDCEDQSNIASLDWYCNACETCYYYHCACDSSYNHEYCSGDCDKCAKCRFMNQVCWTVKQLPSRTVEDIMDYYAYMDSSCSHEYWDCHDINCRMCSQQFDGIIERQQAIEIDDIEESHFLEFAHLI
eukprot:120463_1